jgi:uncharacterized protein (TIGR03435 family)
VAVCLAAATTASAQTQADKPAAALAFEVASIKPAPPIEPMKIMAGKAHIGMSVDAARVDIGSLSLADLIRIAYKIKPYQLSGPEWMSSLRFDVLAKMPEGASKEQVPEMLQGLLADRFKLTVHHDSKEHSVFALVVGKNGSKLKEAEPDPHTASAEESNPAPSKPGAVVIGTGEGQVRVTPNTDGKGATMAGGQFGQMKVSMIEGGMMRMEFAKLGMSELADMLSRFTDRPVIDMTELKGKYQVSMDLSMEEMRNVARAAAAQAGIAVPGPMGGGDMPKSPADAASTPSGNSVLGAVQQMGLKLEQRKLPVETVVVDHLEKTPTEN